MLSTPELAWFDRGWNRGVVEKPDRGVVIMITTLLVVFYKEERILKT